MATAAAAIIAKAQRDVVSHFMAANAVSPEQAIAFQPGRRIRQRQFERLCDSGIIHAAGDDRYWIDAPRYDQWSRSRRKRIGVAIGALAVIGAILATIAG